MTLKFTVGEVLHWVDVSDDQELVEAGERVYAAVAEASGGAPLRQFLRAQILESLLIGLTERCDEELGQVLAG